MRRPLSNIEETIELTPSSQDLDTFTRMSPRQSYVEGEAPASQPVKPKRGSKVTWALLVVCVLLAAALIVICRLSVDNWRTNKNLQTLMKENEVLKKNITESQCKTPPVVQPTCPTPPVLNEPCHICEADWEQHGGQCYYFSTNKSTWNQSRDECRGRGGDLVKIDSREEQIFLEGRLRDKMTEAEDKFWIGLTDSQTEGTWLWVDGSALTTDTSLTFWARQEPDNWTGHNNEYPEGQDCARMGERGGAADLKCWFDKSCKVPHKSICEK
ncbi:CD209 antigen-like protein C isoform X1 [Mugil cephalus]|uniref:CD209 antigen-like protein C isoform X1 n=2 Tax=Mugil cephalus TaxID=48193 RepID=UPI001FB62E91|nr:CD209 antigen-like protein C isoform X1 [Mugil cephalus]